MITIRNLTKRPIVLNLAHAHACSPTECTCGKQKVGVQDHNRETGERIVRAVHQRVPDSVTIFQKGARDIVAGKPDKDGNATQTAKPLDVSGPLLDGVQRLPEVIELLRSGSIKIEPVIDTDGDPTPAATTPSPEAAPVVARGRSATPPNDATTTTGKPSKE